VGRHTDASGVLNVQTAGTIFSIDDISIGRFTNSLGTLNVLGGLLSLTNDSIWTGREGVGTLAVSSGSVLARAIYVGMSEDGTNTPTGTVNLTGGSILLSSNFVVGTALVSTGQVLLTGGVLAITNEPRTGGFNLVNGSVTLSNAALIVDQLTATNGSGQFLFPAGTLQARGATVANGSAFVIGDGVHPATFQLQGGTYSFANGLVISPNATVSGCGTIIGPIFNSGTLNTNCGGGGSSVVITSVHVLGSAATVSFSTVSGATHTLEYKTSLLDPSWTTILPSVVGNGGTTNLPDANATNSSRFYRIHTQ